MSAEVPVLMPQLKTGNAKVLALTAQNRSDVLPDVPMPRRSRPRRRDGARS